MLRNSKSTWQKNNLRCHVCIRQHPPKKKNTSQKKSMQKKPITTFKTSQVGFFPDPPAQQQLEALRSPLQKLPPPIVAGAVARDPPSRIGRGKAPDFLASCVSSLAAPFELNPKQEKRSERWWYGTFFKSVKEIKCALRMLRRVEVGWMLIVIFAHSMNLLNSILLSYSFYFNPMFHLKTSSPNIPQTKIHILTFLTALSAVSKYYTPKRSSKILFCCKGSV